MVSRARIREKRVNSLPDRMHPTGPNEEARPV